MYEDIIPERLAQLRLQKGVSARDMSLSIGQSNSYINTIENKKALPSMQGFFYICEFLGVTPREFFDVETESPTKVKDLVVAVKGLSADQLDVLIKLAQDLRRK